MSIRDGLIAAYEGRKVQVLISGDIATVAVKGPRTGIARPEFEYEIPIADAERKFSTVRGDQLLEKQRFFVHYAGATWHVDVYGGVLQPVVIADIELKQETQELVLPPWMGKEVTGDSFYRKTNMRERAEKALRQKHLVRLDAVPASPQTANCHRSHPSNLLAFRKLGTRACTPRRDGFGPWGTLPLARVCYYRGGCSVAKRPPRKYFRCLPPAYRAQRCLRDGSTKPLILLVGGAGIEPATPSMSRMCSSAELTARSGLTI